MAHRSEAKVVIIGGGFSGLAAAYELSRRGIPVTVLESEPEVGGLAASFGVAGERLERFYHHWFTNDKHIMELVRELGAEDQVLLRPTRTGMYYARSFFRLSSPVDVLRFTPLPLFDRIRLGVMVLLARLVRDWRSLEGITASDWLVRLGGRRVFEVVWEPLLRGKFGEYANRVSAVWFWNKLKLRGSSRGAGGAEMLAYYRGGFAALADRLVAEIEKNGGRVLTGRPVERIEVDDSGRVAAVVAGGERFSSAAVIGTPALPILSRLLSGLAEDGYVQRLNSIEYLANLCLVLELDRSLSSTYWLNVNDPGFPFVGVIEHTNFEAPATYGNRHIVYLSKYLPATDPLYTMDDDSVLAECLPHLQRMFPAFRPEWIQAHHVWRARYAQPVVVEHYSRLLPAVKSPLPGFYICSMAQIYPEDRGTNYAVREGRSVGRVVAEELAKEGAQA